MKKASPDREAMIRIGKLLNATRKHLGLNQTAVAPKLGLDQSALSRVESGKQMLTATQWFTFCQLTGVSPDALNSGTIELNHEESAIRLPSRYAFNKHSKVRSLLPLIHYAKSTLGEAGFETFLFDKQIDPDFLINLNAEINFNFKQDLVKTLIKKTGLTAKNAEAVTRSASTSETHGSLRNFYDYISTDQFSLIRAYVQNASRYTNNFKFEIVGSSQNQLDVAVTPQAHMSEFDYQNDPTLMEFFTEYDKGFFKNLSAYSGMKPLIVTTLESGVYRLTAAAG